MLPIAGEGSAFSVQRCSRYRYNGDVYRRLALLLLLAGCESRYGAYLMVQGDIQFDEVELYFGVPIDSSGPGSGTQFAAPTLGAQSF